MISLPIGLVGFVMIVLFAGSGARAMDYLNLHSFMVVGVGTAVVFMSSTSTTVIRAVFKNVRQLFGSRPTMKRVREDLVLLARDREFIKKSDDPLISYAISLWERGVDSHTFQALISQYRDQLENDDVEAIASLQNIAKYPPALGMLGTVMGMINLFANLGGSDKSGLGPALAVAMTATFYGLMLTNGLIMPLADRLYVEATYRKKFYGKVYEILTLVNRREPSKMIEDEIEHRQAA